MGVALVLAALWPAWVHVDDSDAGLYVTVARRMVAEGAWLSPHYLPNVHPDFREHLPFGLWPFAAAEAVFPSGGGSWLGSALVLWMLWRMSRAHPRFGPPAAVLLGLTPALFGRAGLARLDNLLLPLALEIGLAWWRPATGRFAAARTVGRVGVLGALSVLVKGPFGLLVVGAGAVARAVVDRRWQPLLLGGLAGVLSLMPAGLFLAWDRAHGGTFFEGYVQAQLLASLTGARTDGSTFLLFPFLSVAARFEPFFLLALLGGAWALGRGRSEEPSDVAEQRRDARFVAWLVLAALGALCLPSRKIWNHALPVYPFLALLAGAGWAHLASQARWASWTGRVRTWGTLAVAAVAVVAAGGALVRGGRWGRCAVPPEVAGAVAGRDAASVTVGKGPRQWNQLATLASEYGQRPWLAGSPEEVLAAARPLAWVDAAWSEPLSPRYACAPQPPGRALCTRRP